MNPLYNPEGDAEMEPPPVGTAASLSEYLHGTGRKFMFELLVPADQAELQELDGDRRAYGRSRRPRHMVDARRYARWCRLFAGRAADR